MGEDWELLGLGRCPSSWWGLCVGAACPTEGPAGRPGGQWGTHAPDASEGRGGRVPVKSAPVQLWQRLRDSPRFSENAGVTAWGRVSEQT